MAPSWNWWILVDNNFTSQFFLPDMADPRNVKIFKNVWSYLENCMLYGPAKLHFQTGHSLRPSFCHDSYRRLFRALYSRRSFLTDPILKLSSFLFKPVKFLSWFLYFIPLYSELINYFISSVNYGKDFEEQLGFYVECRAAFSNLDSILFYLVQSVSSLAVQTLNITKVSRILQGSGLWQWMLNCFDLRPNFWTRLLYHNDISGWKSVNWSNQRWGNWWLLIYWFLLTLTLGTKDNSHIFKW